MTGLATPLKIVFDKLDEVTSDETVEERPYAATRSQESIYAITNTQPGESTYAAGEFQSERAPADAPHKQATPSVEQFDCDDPRTCPTCTPRTPTAD